MRFPYRLAALSVSLALAVSVPRTLAESAARAIGPEVSVSRTEANIVWVASRILEHSQFSHHPLDNELAGKLLSGYMDSLDGGHMLFTRSDVNEFGRSQATLAKEIRTDGDTTVAHAIFNRYLKRLGQEVAFLTNALQKENFEFTGQDVFPTDRKNAARPVDLSAAKALWRQRMRFDYLQEKLDDKKAPEIVVALTKRYTRLLRTMSRLRSDEILDTYLNALAHVYDPHSDYMGPEELDSFSISMSLSLSGIGATLVSEDGYCKVGELIAGGPADKSGLIKPGDRILAVAQENEDPVDIVDMPLPRAVELIRGRKGTLVRLTIRPSASTDPSIRKTVSLVRDEIKLEDQQARAQITDLPGEGGSPVRVGVIDLPSFYAEPSDGEIPSHRSASGDVARLLAKLRSERVAGVILDLRRNGGGSLQEAVNLTGLFIRSGPVVQTRGPTGDLEVDEDTDSSVAYGGPLVILTSRFSASASEIVAGALQDYGRAVIVGDSSTFGKGTVQSVVDLAPYLDRTRLEYGYNPGALKVTIRKFYRPGGASTQLKGVAADIVIPSPTDVAGISESALTDPLPWDSAPASKFEEVGMTQSYINTLRGKSARRMAGSAGYTHLREDAQRFRKEFESKTISLNEAERRHERSEAMARARQGEEEAFAFEKSQLAEYVISVKDSARPGLPRPMVPARPPTNSISASNVPIDESLADSSGSRSQNSPTDELVLHEAEEILADYARLLDSNFGRTVQLSPK